MRKYRDQILGSFFVSLIMLCLMDALYMGIEHVQLGLNLFCALVATVIVMAIMVISKK